MEFSHSDDNQKVTLSKFESMLKTNSVFFFDSNEFENIIHHYLENGKTISRIWVEKSDVSVSNRNYWDAIFDFFNEKMASLELFYAEYDEFIKTIEMV